jgi:hypothetical protein
VTAYIDIKKNYSKIDPLGYNFTKYMGVYKKREKIADNESQNERENERNREFYIHQHS